MPIRFRCTHCQKLLGIAHRKAGTMVPCPKCGRETLVPQGEQEPSLPPTGGAGPAAGAPPPPGPDVPLFEQRNFEALLNDGGGQAQPSILGARAPVPPAAPGRVARPGPGSPDVEPLGPVPTGPQMPPGGFVLTRRQATVLTVAIVVVMVLAFGAGLLVGRYFL
jgi:hypothetical protein